MRLSEVIEVRDFPAVVQADAVRAARFAGNENSAHQFVAAYLGYDAHSRHALETALKSLSTQSSSIQSARGGAFFINGVFGSGKSHLLGVLALLCDGLAHTTFAHNHPAPAPFLENFAPRFTLHFSLDEYSAAQFSLEEIFWNEARLHWTRCGFPASEFPISEVQPAGEAQLSSSMAQPLSSMARSENFTVFLNELQKRGSHGIALFIDELSLFLGGREHAALQRDAAFLQFLGQFAARDASTRAPLWVFAALQKTAAQIGDMDSYALSQISDRFATLSLALAHLPAILEHRLIVRRDAQKVDELNRESYRKVVDALPHFSLGTEEWNRCYPFHPITIELLEEIAARYGSRTRSALGFCSAALNLEADADARVLAPALFDHFLPVFAAHPDLAPFMNVWHQWEEWLRANETTAPNEETQWLRATAKTLMLFSIVGRTATPLSLADALLPDFHLRDDGNYHYLRVLLEKLRLEAGRVQVQRDENTLHDIYEVDAQEMLAETVRRLTQNAMHDVPRGDRRIARHVVSCCNTEALPLASLRGANGRGGLSQTIFWRNVPRGVRLHLVSQMPSADFLANEIASLQGANESDDLLLFIVSPFLENENDGESDQAHLWREALEMAWKKCVEANPEYSSNAERWKNAVLWWVPRAATPSEWNAAREATAQHLLLRDPQLADNKSGRAALSALKKEGDERAHSLARLALRLLHEGSLGAHQLALDAADVVAGETWSETLESLAALLLPALYPQLENHAPRLRVLSNSAVETLCLEVLRRPADAPFFAASHERLVRALAAPLGIAHDDAGRRRITPPSPALREALLRTTREMVELPSLQYTFRKNQWGLDALQTNLAVCALLRSGELLAFDKLGAVLPPAQIAIPLERAVRSLRAGATLSPDAKTKIAALLGALELEEEARVLGNATDGFAAQMRAQRALIGFREEREAEAELMRARLSQLQRALESPPPDWTKSENALRRFAALLAHLREAEQLPFAAAMLESVAAFDAEEARSAFQNWREYSEKIETRHAPLLAARAFLFHSKLALPAHRREVGENLRARINSGEHILEDAAFFDDFADLKSTYKAEYSAWHSAQNAPEKWEDWRALAASEEWRGLQKLRFLRQRTVPQIARVQALLQSELEKRCAYDGRPTDSPICAACGLALGEENSVASAGAAHQLLESAASALRAMVREEETRSMLENHPRGGALLQWSESGDTRALQRILDEETLQVFDAALQPRRRVARSWHDLKTATQNCRTRRDWEAAFASWLDGDENLSPDDLIEALDDATS